MDTYARTVREAANKSQPSAHLLEDEIGISELSNAVKTLALTLQAQNSSLEADRAKLASVLDQMTDEVFIVDAQGRVTFHNPAAARLFESQNDVGRSVAEILRLHQLVEAWRR